MCWLSLVPPCGLMPKMGKIYLGISLALWMEDILQHSSSTPINIESTVPRFRTTPFSIEQLSIKPPDHTLTIPLSTRGIVIYTSAHTPTSRELLSLPHIILTSSAIWDPLNVMFLSHQVEGGENTEVKMISISKHHFESLNMPIIEPGLSHTLHDPASLAMQLITLIQVHDTVIMMICLQPQLPKQGEAFNSISCTSR